MSELSSQGHLFSTITVASQQVSLVSGQRYAITPTVACWLAFGSNPTASAAAGSAYVPADRTVEITGGPDVVKLAVVRASGDGSLSIAAAR